MLVRTHNSLELKCKLYKEHGGKQRSKVRKMIPLPVGQLEWVALGGIMCLLPIVWFIIAILLCIWVYRDAESRGMGGALWLIIVLISGIIGLIIYLVVRKEKKSGATQPPPS
jgi:hypothetical protein